MRRLTISWIVAAGFLVAPIREGNAFIGPDEWGYGSSGFLHTLAPIVVSGWLVNGVAAKPIQQGLQSGLVRIGVAPKKAHELSHRMRQGVADWTGHVCFIGGCVLGWAWGMGDVATGAAPLPIVAGGSASFAVEKALQPLKAWLTKPRVPIEHQFSENRSPHRTLGRVLIHHVTSAAAGSSGFLVLGIALAGTVAPSAFTDLSFWARYVGFYLSGTAIESTVRTAVAAGRRLREPSPVDPLPPLEACRGPLSSLNLATREFRRVHQVGWTLGGVVVGNAILKGLIQGRASRAAEEIAEEGRTLAFEMTLDSETLDLAQVRPGIGGPQAVNLGELEERYRKLKEQPE